MAGICTRITNFFGYQRTGQAKIDRDLYPTNQILRLTKAIERLAERTHLSTRHAYFLGGFAAFVNIYAGNIAFLAIAANECRLYYQNNTSPYVINSKISFHENLKSFEGQILKNFEDGNRNRALLALVKLESQFEVLDDKDKTLKDKFKLEALREIITKNEPTGIEKILFLKLWIKNLNAESRGLWKSLKNYYAQNRISSRAKAILKFWIENYRSSFDCIQEGERVYIPNLSEQNFLCYFDTFLHSLGNDVPDPNRDKALTRVNFQCQIMTQFWNFYRAHKQNFFFSGKLFEKYMLDASKRIFSMHERIINREHPEEVEVEG